MTWRNNGMLIKNPWPKISDIQILASKNIFMAHAKQ